MKTPCFSLAGLALAMAFLTAPLMAAEKPVEGPAPQELRKKFDKWISERAKLQKEHREHHQKVHEKKRQVKQRQNFLPQQHERHELEFDTILAAPDDPELWPLWRDWLTQWRKDKRKALDYDDAYYSHEAFAWVPSNYVSGFTMLWDMTLLDPDAGRYTVKEFLEHGNKEFGGYDSVVLWLGYPLLGIDRRNQFDMYRDMPGGLEGMRELTKNFHKHGVEVVVPFLPWDTETRSEGKSNADALVDLVRAIDADGIYLDTWYEGWPFRAKLDAVRPGLVMDVEMALPIRNIAGHQMSWGQNKPWRTWLFDDSHAPGILKSKWFERRHVVRPNNRWVQNRVGELHVSWMNGTGTVVWENRFGLWNGWSERARSILRSMIPIQRRYVALFAGEGWVPLVQHRGEDIFASLWKGDDSRLWTLVNRADKPHRGNLLAVAHERGTRYFDLIRGKEAEVEIKENVALIDGKIDAKGIGGFLALPEKALTSDFDRFLRKQRDLFSRRNWDPSFPERKPVPRTVTRTRQRDRGSLPPAMAAVDAGTVELRIDYHDNGRPIGFHDPLPKERKLELPPYAVDLTPVTNGQFAKFLRSSGYQPRCRDNFLKHWVDGKPPAGKEDHPVVYVDLSDARAYAKWAGKRLPTDEEWQYAAEGPQRLKYPWGHKWEDDNCNDGNSDGTTSVHDHPDGRSPFGCYDMCGNTWEWTESERTDDGRTRYCLIRGGSYLKAGGSAWYVNRGAQPNHRATKLLLVWPGLDRRSTIGFRCVVDLAK